ncbi:MAG: Type 1 glutamine amidotransferase (GATase1/Cytochrome c, mono- and diheme variants) [Verrucomicrobia bacterium]|nr:MAG: Type 1 glutamine amidotransferase (GATase1/Cytochrome c, mono- and diheme variants) [Verrucomicrobiota bacterium]
MNPRLFVALSLALTGFLNAAEVRPLRVLFLGHDKEHHNSTAYVPILMNAMGREAIFFDYQTSPDCLNPATLQPYDALLLYANHGNLKPEQFEALNAFIEGGKGFLPIHCASACFGNDPRFIALVGGRFKSHKSGVFKATIVDRSHPILQGVNEYETWDETYVHDQINAQSRHLLMERVEGEHREPWAWTRTQGQGRIFYTASGHDERTWQNPEFQKLLRNAIVWAVGDQARAAWENFLASREPEKREPNPEVANYEKRPQPITFQHPFTPKGSMERTQVPADCRLELFAAEPEIGKPIALAWDDRGRCWVAETSDYPHGVKEDGIGSDRIRICEDSDGDGRADKFTVFAEGLNIPTGLVFANGGLIVSQPPRFLFLQDTDGDDRADVRKEIMNGWGIGDTHAQASNLHHGYDNWLYGAVGYSGFKGTVGGRQLDFKMGTYRFRADGSALEFLHQFTNNTWAHGDNDAGDQFGGTANGAPIFFGGIPDSAKTEGMQLMTAKKINVIDAAHPITPNFRQVDVFGGYTAAAGSAFVYSNALPARFQGKALVCEPTMKLVSVMDVRPDGAGYQAWDGMNLFASSDEWTSPVYAEVGPDGAVWIADFHNFIIQHNPTPSVERGGFKGTTGVGGAHENSLRDHSRGRIYRVIGKAAKPIRKSLAGAGPAQLVAALDDDVQYWRLLAQHKIVEARVDAAPLLTALVTANDGRTGAIHALWALQGLGALPLETHRAALLAKDARLRRNAVRALGSDAASQSLFFGAGVVSDPDPGTRLAAMVKLASFPTTPEIQTLVKQLGADGKVRDDEWLKEASRLLSKRHRVELYKDGPNLLTNGDLEKTGADGFPEGWKRRDYGGPPKAEGNKTAEWQLLPDQKQAHSGKAALRCLTKSDADTSFYQDVPLKPGATYRLSGWVKAKGLRGKASFNDHIGRAETEKVTSRDSGWVQVETVFVNKDKAKASINILHVAKGEAFYDDILLCEVMPVEDPADQVLAGDPGRGEQIFWKHPVAACMNCHMLGGKGSPVGPALDGIAARKNEAYITQSLLEPNAILAEGYVATPISPMPPMGLILKPQEIADVKAFVLTLK